MTKFRSPYNIPREAEHYARDLVVSTVQTLFEVVSLSLFPALGLFAFGFGLSWLDSQVLMLPPEQFAVNSLAALSTGCVRIYLRQDNYQQEVELR